MDPTKRLLILDINGVLVRRETFQPHHNHSGQRGGRAAKRSFVKRPHCDAFLDWAFANFNVGVWSCGKRETMEMELFAGRPLVFTRSQNDSTSLWPRRSVVAIEKPLFLKELSRLWEADSRFHAGNTILLDNHAEKFERNPVGTCVLVRDFVAENGESDDALSLGGELVRHLTAMAQAADLAAYAREHASDAPFAFLSEQLPAIASNAPPSLTGGTNNNHGAAAAAAAANPAVQLRLRRALAMLFTSSPTMKRNSPERDVEFYMQHPDTPGPRAVPLRRADVVNPPNGPAAWVACEKTDGVRSLLMVLPASDPVTSAANASAFLVNRAWEFRPVTVSDAVQRVANTHGAVLLDGELVPCETPRTTTEDQSSPTPSTAQGFVLFDVVFWGDKGDVGSIPDVLARLAVFSSTSTTTTSPNDNDNDNDDHLPIVTKTFLPLSQLQEKIRPLVEQGFCDYGAPVGKVKVDGVVLTPRRETYYGTTVLKWKASDETTVDFCLTRRVAPNAAVAELALQVRTGFDRNANAPRFTTLPVAELTLDASARESLARVTTPIDARTPLVVECALDTREGRWRLVRVRADKSHTNSLSTAWRNLECLATPVRLEDLVFPSPSPATSGADTAAALVSDVAAHYDERQRARNEAGSRDRLDDSIRVLRNMNNCVKALTIEAMRADVVELPGGVASFAEACPLPSPRGTRPMPAELTRATPPAPAGHRGRRPKKPAPATTTTAHKGKLRAVLDLACGRGGDLLKWRSDDLATYVGVDVSQEALTEAERRVGALTKSRTGGNGNALVARFVHADANDAALVELVTRAAGAEPPQFDCVAVHFAVHYLVPTLESAERFFASAAKLCRVGGRLLVTTLDIRVVKARLEGVAEWRNDVCAVRLVDASTPIDVAAFGREIVFSLGDAVVDCREPLVPLGSVSDVAAKAGFKLVSMANFADVVSEGLHSDDAAFVDLMGDMRVLEARAMSPAEWDVVGLYVAAVWERSLPS